jgi:hypothetical protein
MSPKSGPKPMQDVTAPKPAATSEDTGLIQTELEHGIPVRNPDQPADNLKGAAASSNPITQSKQSVEESNKKEEELEPILKDVNQSVAKQDKNASKKSKFSLFKKSAGKKEAQESKPKNTKPIFAVLAAVLVAGALSVAAFYAFKPKEATNSKGSQSDASNGVGSSSNQAQTVNKAVQPADLANLASSLQSKMNSLDDAQDFNQTDLSDQSLGL